MRYSKDKKINEVVRLLLRQGWAIKSRKKHLRLENAVTRDHITVPGSPSDHRATQNWLHHLRNKHGVEFAC